MLFQHCRPAPASVFLSDIYLDLKLLNYLLPIVVQHILNHLLADVQTCHEEVLHSAHFTFKHFIIISLPGNKICCFAFVKNSDI